MSLSLAADMLCEWKKTTMSFKGRSTTGLTCKNPLSPTRALRGRCCYYPSHLTSGGAITPKPSGKGTGERVPVPTWPLHRHAFQALGTVPGPGREMVNEVIFAFKVRFSWGKQTALWWAATYPGLQECRGVRNPTCTPPQFKCPPKGLGRKIKRKNKGYDTYLQHYALFLFHPAVMKSI